MEGYLTRVVRSGGTPLATIDRLHGRASEPAPPVMDVEETVTSPAPARTSSGGDSSLADPQRVAGRSTPDATRLDAPEVQASPRTATLPSSAVMDATSLPDRVDAPLPTTARLARIVADATRLEPPTAVAPGGPSPAIRRFQRAPRFDAVTDGSMPQSTAPAPESARDRTGVPGAEDVTPVAASHAGAWLAPNDESAGAYESRPGNAHHETTASRIIGVAGPDAPHGPVRVSASAAARAIGAARLGPDLVSEAADAEARVAREHAGASTATLTRQVAYHVIEAPRESSGDASVTIDRLEIQLVDAVRAEPAPAPAPPAPYDDWSALQRLAAARLW